MDIATAAIVIIGIFALIVFAAFVIYRWRNKVEIKGPFGTELRIDGSNEQGKTPPAVNVEGVESRMGGVVADDHTGHGAQVKDAKVYGDILASSSPPPENPESKN